MKIFVIIPAYNEELWIGSVVRKCHLAGYKNILVVDDGSSDHTVVAAEKAKAKVLRHFINRGVGAATQTGLQAARMLKADLAVTIDADGQHLPSDIDKLVNSVVKNKVDIAIGSRFLKNNSQVPLLRRWFNVIANVITWLLSGVYLSDSQSGLKAFSKKALAKMNITANGYEFSSEVIREAVYHGLKVKEVSTAVIYTPYSLSKGQNFSTGLSTVFKLVIRSFMR